MFPQLQIRREGARINTKIKNHAAIIYATQTTLINTTSYVSVCVGLNTSKKIGKFHVV